MAFIPLNCPNCNGRIEYKEDEVLKCPYCETELLLKQNHVYYVDQTINHYHGTVPEATPKPSVSVSIPLRLLLVLLLVISGAIGTYFYYSNSSTYSKTEANLPVRKMPESEVLLSFLRDIFDKGSALPTEEELARLRYLTVEHSENDQWTFTYSLSDPFSDEQAEKITYVTQDKKLNSQEIDQRDFEAFTGLTALDLTNTYEISQTDQTTLAHMSGLKSYGGAFNESFSTFSGYFGDKTKITELSTQLRSNQELAMLLEFPNLSSLSITYVDESVTDFFLLNKLPLKSLSLTFVDELGWLSSMTGLSSLSIHYSETTDLQPLYALTQLQELQLSFLTNVKSIDFVQNMPALQTLDLENVNFSSLEPLADKASITTLRLASLSQLASVKVINSLPSLRELTLSGYYEKAEALTLPNVGRVEIPSSFLTGLKAPATTSLTLRGGSGELNLAALGKFPKLEQLSLWEIDEITRLGALDGLPSLETLNIYDSSLYKESDALFRLKQIKSLMCSECRLNFEQKSATENSVLEHLALEQPYFSINNNSVNEVDQMMPYFANMPALRSFTLQDSNLSSLEFMSNWQAIEELHLENNAISNIETLSQLPNLQKVYLSGNSVQNKSVLGTDVHVY
ncbi:cell wall anchor protein [Paenibacillus sp. MYb63]|uniref:leucine-rich repeat domain-containing protein n=1 Tax=Paenibacillus sp. 37 TaxID=2607911 RepID=UPI000CFD6BAE|nr:leucine-rich repeat domain-containing protein [Paenibacillus sp. 37]PQZ99030.1 cell wall anchor protein [Paenibacillus sp. MYb63]PRA43969.1 cell wall anchor protein [Paenibacillus sp. MYb67]QZN77851.1 leucine-rich repeat domain-containing protein [Paenibacillus sp. DR312]